MKRILIVFLILLTILCFYVFYSKGEKVNDTQDEIELINSIYDENISQTRKLLSKINKIDFIVGASQMGIDDDSDNSSSKWELTPLENACFVGNTTIIQMLIDKGADVNYVDSGLNSPLIWAIYSGNNKRNKNIEILIKEGANVNRKDYYGNTPLILSTMNNDLVAVRVLLKHGANKKLKNYKNKTAIDYAREDNNSKLIKMLK